MAQFPALDHNSPIPLHAQIEAYLRDLIQRPKYKQGKLLPKEKVLAAAWKTSRNTVRQAISRLVMEGLIQRKKGVGSIVVEKHFKTRLDAWNSFTQEMNQQGIRFQNLEVVAREEPADVSIAQALQIKEGDKVVCLERLKSLNGEPIILFISYFHPRIGVSRDDDFRQPLYQMLQDKYSVAPKSSQETISAIAAEGELAKRLKIRKGDPVLYRRRTVADESRRPMEYNVGYYRGDRFDYVISLHLE